MKWIFVIFSLILVEVYSTNVIYHRFMNDSTNTTTNGKKINFGIVGGTTASISNFKHQVQVCRKNSQICGGSVITSNAVLCAAHCVIDVATNFLIRVGSSTRNFGAAFYVTKIVKHPNFNDKTYDNDVSIFFTRSSMLTVANVAIIPLRTSSDFMSIGKTTVVSGWGTTSEGGSSSSTLREVSVPYISSFQCSLLYSGVGAITTSMLCTLQGGKDSCQGDSGGGLVATFGTTRKLIGIVSWGNGCARSKYPGVYTDVTAPSISKFISDTLITNRKKEVENTTLKPPNPKLMDLPLKATLAKAKSVTLPFKRTQGKVKSVTKPVQRRNVKTLKSIKLKKAAKSAPTVKSKP